MSDEATLIRIASNLADALEFHRRTPEGKRKECLPGCVGCAAIAAWERHTGRDNWTGAEHVDRLDCWCRPYQDTVEPTVFIHREAGRA